MKNSLTVRILGPTEVVGPTGPAVLTGTRQRALVALLALNAGNVVTASRLVDAMYGENPPRTAIRTVQSHLARVRQAFDQCGLPNAVITKDPGYVLAVPRSQVDAHVFQDLVRGGRTVEVLTEALGLWRGDALADVDLEGWAAAEVERLHDMRLVAYEDLWAARIQLGEDVLAITELDRLVAEHPVRERLIELLMLALYRAGRPADALDRYDRFRRRLADELGIDPSASLQRLHGSILRGDPGLTGSPIPAQLPPRTGHFAGRRAELAMLRPDAPIALVSGPAGVGKTAFALEWAHDVVRRFPDGQLFLDLHGHDPDTALTPAEAATHVLRGLGVSADRVPATVEEQAALFRSLVHDKRVLIVLDNAGTADHVLPLVPATAGSLVLVTSRRHLSALSVRHSVRSVELDVLAPGEASALLASILGAERLRGQPVDQLVALCGRLPLALRIAAAKLAARPRQPLADMVTDLTADRLDVLSVDGDSVGLRAVFASAYEALSEPAAALFRALGVHPGESFGAHLAAAVMDVSYGRARRWVDELASAHLITETAFGQYRFHDLIRLYARECVAPDQIPDIVARLVDWYLVIAAASNKVFGPTRNRVSPTPAHIPDALPFDQDAGAILSFLDGERANMVPVVAYAAENGHQRAACDLTYLLAGYYDRRGHWNERITLCRWAVQAARQLGDPGYEALMRSALGVACIAARRFDDALTVLRGALALTYETRDLRHVYNNMAVAYAGLRRFTEAAEAFDQALTVHGSDDPGPRDGVEQRRVREGAERHRRPARAVRGVAAGPEGRGRGPGGGDPARHGPGVPERGRPLPSPGAPAGVPGHLPAAGRPAGHAGRADRDRVGAAGPGRQQRGRGNFQPSAFVEPRPHRPPPGSDSPGPPRRGIPALRRPGKREAVPEESGGPAPPSAGCPRRSEPGPVAG
ncbi:BTAD domain-containing putative transcriptional regulator [Kibdelosporangium lantanae]